MSTTARLVVATDGSALGNPGPSGWAWAAAAPHGAPVVWRAGAITHSTNNIAELTALQQALTEIPASVPLEVRADSQYVINCVTDWIHGWRRRQWRTAKGEPVKNADLIRAIDELLTGRDVTFVWVKAHVRGGGDPLNEFVDAAAQAAARSVRSKSAANTGPGWPT